MIGGIRASLAAGLAGMLLSSCATPVAAPRPDWDLFAKGENADPFAPRVRLWQASERLQGARVRMRALDGLPSRIDTPLARAHREFRAAARARLARDTLIWVQAQSRQGYQPDAGGDAWPVLDEMLQVGRDDCDGWELLQFSTLRELGFGPGELYRAILVRPASGPERQPAYHMVTLWFPAGERVDPWVLDPTGSISRSLVRLSALPGWRPVRLFDEVDQFAARAPRTPVAVPE